MTSEQDEPVLPPSKPEVSPWVLITFEAALLPIGLVAGWILSIDPKADIVWSLEAIGLGLAAAIPPLALVLALDWLRPRVWQGMTRTVDELLIPMLRHWSWGQLLLVSLLAGLGEEIVFRGVMLPALATWIGVYAALVISSITFGAVHAITRMYVVYATLMGLYLGVLWLASENLAIPILAHAAYDFVALAWFVRLRPPVSVTG